MLNSHLNDTIHHQQNNIEEQRSPRPQRRRRGTRCGTNSHYLYGYTNLFSIKLVISVYLYVI